MRGHSYNPEGCPRCGKVHIPPFQGKHHSEETKKKSGQKISKANADRKQSKESNEKRSKSLSGKKKSESYRKKKSEQQKGIPLSERGHRPNCMCKAGRGEMVGKNNPFYERHHKQETISNLSEQATRRLSLGFGKVIGYFYSIKNEKSIPYRSTWELLYMQILEQDDDVILYNYEKIRVPYTDKKGNKKYTVPDFLVCYRDGTKAIVEVRPFWRIEDVNTKLKMGAVNTFCNQNKYKSTWVYEFTDKENFKQVEFSPIFKETKI